jgi:thiamine-phosphate pyrophosphorylase
MNARWAWRAPILCLVTDTRRLCPQVPFPELCRCVVAQTREAVAVGVDLIQIRERHLPAVELASLVSATVDAARGSATRVLVNDRLDVALACGAAGVHLPADSVPPWRVRADLPAGFLVGRSVHSLGEARRVGGDVDYLIAGTVFPSASKPAGHELLGAATLGSIVRAVETPVLAIGGVTLERVPSVAATGAAGLAAIGLFTDVRGDDPCGATPLGTLAAAVRAAFDRPETAP